MSQFLLLILSLQTIAVTVLTAANSKAQVKSIYEIPVDLNLSEAPILESFRQIQLTTGFEFSYNSKIINRNQKVSVNGKTTFGDLLENISMQTGLKFKRIDNNIHVYKRIGEDRAVEEKKSKQQEIRVSGRITDENGEPLLGATILEKGTTNGVVTDIEGNYEIVVDENATLVISYIGYLQEEVAVNGNPDINFSLIPDITALGEVVVTAFGIKREEKALSYATQEVEGEKISSAGNTDVTNALQGKVAGVSIKRSSGMPGAANSVIIRGNRSLTGNNQPLYVIDGLPISSSGGSISDGAQGVVSTNRTLDINPNDIESISVLKGPAAAALYGLRASNGVILITTKSGRNAKKGVPIITINTNYTVDKISKVPDNQLTYAQGEGGVFNPVSGNSFGPKIEDLGSYTNNVGELVEARAYDNISPFFKSGYTYNLSADVSNATDLGHYNVGVGYAKQAGIVENTGLSKYNAKFAGNFNLSEKLALGVSSNLSMSNTDLMETGSSRATPFSTLYYIPPSYDFYGTPINELNQPYNQIYYRSAQNNPLWAVRNNNYNEENERFFGNINLSYELSDWLSINYRLGLDTYSTVSKYFYNQGDGSTFNRDSETSSGRIVDISTTNRQLNSNLGISVDKHITENIGLNLLLGNEFYDNRTNEISVDGRDLSIFGFDNIAATSSQISGQSISRIRNVGFYANLSLDYKNMIFLNATGRNDIVSNMPSGNRSFFYPSIGISSILSEMFNIQDSFVNFLKLRATYAEVGQAGPIYVQGATFQSRGPQPQQGSGISFPFHGLNGFTTGNLIINPDLKPQNTQSIELGLNLKLLRNSVEIDYTYFSDNSVDQIFNVPVSTTTGFTNELRNAGELKTTGHEVILSLFPIRADDFNWKVDVNFSTYDNEVVSLAEGVEYLDLGGTPIGSSRAVAGHPYPVLWASKYLRDESGNIVVESRPDNPRYGIPLQDPQQGVVGEVQPDFEVGFINSMTYKGLTLSFQIDWRKGGDILTGTDRLGKLFGTLAVTEDRESDFIEPGVKGYVDAEGNLTVEGPNDIVIQRDQQYWTVTNGIREGFVHDGSFVRLRELSLDYNIPQAIVGKIGLDAASIYLTGRNLWLSTDFPNVDPETSFGGTTNAQGLEYNSLPQTKSFGGGLRLTF